MKTQICILCGTFNYIGGIETFVYNFCNLMKDKYQIIVATKYIPDNQYDRFKKIVQVVDFNDEIECDTLLVMHIAIKGIPNNIKYKKKIQLVHGCKSIAYSDIPNADLIVPVSEAARISYGDDFKNKNVKAILNPIHIDKPKKILKLISATRLTPEKGGNRIRKLAQLLNEKNIPFVWYVFSTHNITSKKHDHINGIVNMPYTLDIASWIKECDYLVQLSDTESFCYSIVEALELGIPVLTTPLDVLDEIGFKDGVNGYTLPFDMEGIDIDKIYNSNLKFEYKYDNNSIANEWCKVLGDPKPFIKYNYKEVNMWIKATKNITFAVEHIDAIKGHYYEVSEERARVIVKGGAGVYATNDELISAGVIKPEVKEEKVDVVEEAVPVKEDVVEKATIKKVVKKTAPKKATTKKAK